jgi:hypothetical protein
MVQSYYRGLVFNRVQNQVGFLSVGLKKNLLLSEELNKWVYNSGKERLLGKGFTK